MANIVSYNDLIELFEDISRRHYQINTFFLGRDWELENNNDLQYPVLQVYPEVAKMPINNWKEYKTLDLTFNVKVIDLTVPGEENERDVHSDTLRIAQDIVNELNQHPYYIRSNVSLMEDIDFTAIEEFEDDVTAGWQFNLKLRIINANTFCGMPMAELNGVSAAGPTSQGTIVNVQYLTCETLPDCPTIVTIDETLVSLQEQIDNLPPSNNTLAQTLLYGNTTGGQYMLSDNGFSRLGLFSNQTLLTYQNLAVVANLEHGDYYTQLSYTDGVNSGNFNVQSTMSEIVHNLTVSLNAPNILVPSGTANTLQYLDTNKYLKSITLGSGLDLTAGVLSTLTPSLSGVAPIVYSAGAISITQATTVADGYLSSTDWNIFNNKADASTTVNIQAQLDRVQSSVNLFNYYYVY